MCVNVNLYLRFFSFFFSFFDILFTLESLKSNVAQLDESTMSVEVMRGHSQANNNESKGTNDKHKNECQIARSGGDFKRG